MWEDVYSRYSPELLRYAWGFCESPAQAEDAVQETFLRSLQAGENFLGLGASQQRAWLYRTLKNLLCDRHRRTVLEAAYLETQESEAGKPDSRQEQVEVLVLLQKLPEPDRTLFYLRYLEDYTAAELAEMFHLPPGTVRSKLSRSRQILRKFLEN